VAEGAEKGKPQRLLVRSQQDDGEIEEKDLRDPRLEEVQQAVK